MLCSSVGATASSRQHPAQRFRSSRPANPTDLGERALLDLVAGRDSFGAARIAGGELRFRNALDVHGKLEIIANQRSQEQACDYMGTKRA